MKTNLVRLMAIATLATSMSFAAENNSKRTESAQTANTMQQEKAAKKARKAEQEKKQKENPAQQSNDPTLSIWG